MSNKIKPLGYTLTFSFEEMLELRQGLKKQIQLSKNIIKCSKDNPVRLSTRKMMLKKQEELLNKLGLGNDFGIQDKK